MSFDADIRKFAKKFGMTHDEAFRGIAISLFSGVVLDTPVEEGTLRGGWNVSLGAPDESITNKKDPSGARTITQIKTTLRGISMDSEVSMTNPLPYAPVVEYGLYPTGSVDKPDSKVTPEGYSKKAPAGMVRRNVARIQRIVAESVKKAKAKVR